MGKYDDSYKKGVETRKKKYGEDFHKKIGSKGGQNNPLKFTSERSKAALKIRWDKYRAEKANLKKGEKS